ncbi:MaoC family dehydratase N-terminal domain-containing protein [Microbacterium indicum]|uniref:MaoC family dehydratase N-terminal domain-containing protein n=1 Tax=Microbacterium indicum TaxID=358100 RepID=UPI000409C380|nr:MaoC family dehydratase N-terminal domain-containing protein [Microbacterium indicum]
MAVDPELASREFPPTAPYLVGREKVREFARAVFATAPQHTDVEAARAQGYADVVAPPTFAMLIANDALQFMLDDPTTGISLERALHTDQSFTWSRPIVAGDELTGRIRVTRVRAMGAASMVASETEIVDQNGEHVVTAASTLLISSDEEA